MSDTARLATRSSQVTDFLLAHRSIENLTSQALKSRPAQFCSSPIRNNTVGLQRGPPVHRLNPYQRALISYERADRRRTLDLARETRRALVMEEKLAVQVVREAEVMLELLKSAAKKAHLRVEEATLEIGIVRAALQDEGIPETTSSSTDDEEFTFEFGPRTSDPVSDSEGSDTGGSSSSAGAPHAHTSEDQADETTAHMGLDKLTEEALSHHDTMSAASTTNV